MDHLGQPVNEWYASVSSCLRGQKDYLAHIAEVKIIQMTFLFQVSHAHCPVKLRREYLPCCKIYFNDVVLYFYGKVSYTLLLMSI